MKYLVDEALCAGHGRCAAVAPEVYELAEDGRNAVLGAAVDVATSQESAARTGAWACPEQAIRVNN